MARRTVAEVKAELARNGVPIAAWAEANGFRPLVVYRVLSGQYKACHGQAHRVAVLLGLKDGAVVEPNEVKNVLAA